MCTAIILSHVHAEHPLIIAANRDELFAREAVGPTVLVDRPRIVGGRDLVGGGTWLAVSASGAFAMVTNQRDLAPMPVAERSRGQLVVDLLSLAEPAAMRSYLAGLDARAYRPFNLLCGDARRLHLGYGRRDRAAVELAEVPDGISVLPNDVLESPDFATKVRRAHALVEPIARRPWPELRPALFAALADHQRPDQVPALANLPAWLPPAALRELSALCIHTPLYGTRSASVVALAPGRVASYWFSDGPPCTTAAVDVTALVTDG